MLFRFLFLLTLVPAVYVGFRRGGDCLVVSIVLLGSFAISIFGWSVINPIWTNAVADTLCAAFIAIFCTNNYAIRVGFLFVASALISITLGVYIYPETNYNPIYAHALSVLGHVENLTLLYGATDDGFRSRLRSFFRPLGASIRSAGFHRSRSHSEDDGS